MDLGTTLIVVCISVALEAFFSGSEIALISVNRIKIQHKAGEGNVSARAVLDLLKTPERIFATTSLGTNLAVVTSTSFFAAYMVTHFAENGDLYATLILAPLILFGGEIVPKLVFQTHADALIHILVWPLKFFNKIFSPVNFLFTRISGVLLKGILAPEQIKAKTFSREMIRQIIRIDSKTSELDIAEKKMIHKIFNFGEITVEQCMVPLIQIYAIKDTATLEEAHQIAVDSGYSRLPVFHERMFNLIGILNTFDLLNLPRDNSPIDELIRPAYYVPPNKKIDDLLKELQQRGLHMAIVVDEYGGCIGIITIEDLLEEIVGEIEDEYDRPEKRYESYADKGYLVEADMEIGAINEAMNLNLPKGAYETLAGLIIDRLGKIPSPGEQVVVNGYRLTVRDTTKRKINTVIVREISANAEGNAAPGMPGGESKTLASPPTPGKPPEPPRT
ncbi:MAG: HlyC/CorC family transporter [Nitrospinae bacterium]|nr:HlyC/CorC family transporter [Nitrospinota bacterium]